MDQSVSNLVLIAWRHEQSIKLIQSILKQNKKRIILDLTNDPLLKKELMETDQSSHCIELKQLLQRIWQLRTKYYDCSIKLHLFEFDYFGDSSKQLNISPVDGIFFIVKAEQNNKICDNLIGTHNPGLQGIIYDRKEGSKINQAQIESEEKNLENFVEAIYEDLDNMSSKQLFQRQQTLAESDEARGYERIMEIMECNMWTTMSKIDQPSQSKQKQENEKEIEDEEEEMGNIADLLQEMKEMKQESLNDDQRKQRAEELLQKFMKVCNLDEDDL